MKRFFNLIVCAAALFSFAACEDVPAPYQPNFEGNGVGADNSVLVTSTGLSDFTVSTLAGTAWSPGNTYAKASGYDGTSKTTIASKSYIVSPKMDLTNIDAAYITYDYALQYTSGISDLEKKHQCLVAADYNNDPTTTTWEVVNIPLNTTGKDGSTWLFDNVKVAMPEAVMGKSGVVVAFYFECDDKSSTTWEIKNFSVRSGQIENEEQGEGGASDTKEITCATAAELCNALADNASSDETYTVTGYITDVFGSVSKGQQSFWMDDTKDGGKVLQAYWANLPEGVSAFTKGSKVKITGKLLKYVKDGAVTPEIKNATVEILEDGNDNQGGGDVTDAKEVNCATAAELCKALADNASSEETYAVTGYITDVYASISRGQQSFWMDDTKDGGKVLQAYWANLPEGVSAFTKGSKVKITGKLLKYVKDGAVTPEIKNANVEILEKGEGDEGDGGDSGDGGNTPTGKNLLTNGDFELWTGGQPDNWQSASTASNATLSQSTVAHGGSYAVKVAAGGTANKRLAYKEIELQAGKYTFSFYAKSTTTDASQCQPGYVPIEGGKAGTYKYLGYASINNSDWTLVKGEFELTATTTVCLVVMNPKTSDYATSQDILIDDASLVKM